MKYPKDSSLPHPGIHQAKVDARLNAIEANATNIKHNFVGHTRSILDRLGIIEERLNGLAKVVNDVDLRIEDTFEELSNEEYLLADKICLEIKEYMSQFVDTDEKVVDNLCEIVMHRIVGDSDGTD